MATAYAYKAVSAGWQDAEYPGAFDVPATKAVDPPWDAFTANTPQSFTIGADLSLYPAAPFGHLADLRAALPALPDDADRAIVAYSLPAWPYEQLKRGDWYSQTAILDPGSSFHLIQLSYDDSTDLVAGPTAALPYGGSGVSVVLLRACHVVQEGTIDASGNFVPS